MLSFSLGTNCGSTVNTSSVQQHHISDNHESLKIRFGIPPKLGSLGGTAVTAEERSAKLPYATLCITMFYRSFLLFRNSNYILSKSTKVPEAGLDWPGLA